jgi:alkylated DNA repair dioxygenase AlkB
LREALAAVTRAVDAPVDSIGLNLYRDHHDSVAPHNDKLEDLVRGEPIVLLSLGATRRMTIRGKKPPRRVLHVDLEAGSLLLMSHATQYHYDHGIPKQREPVGPRISLAFRVRGARLHRR